MRRLAVVEVYRDGAYVMACGCELADEVEPGSGVIKGSIQAFCPARLRILILCLWQSA